MEYNPTLAQEFSEKEAEHFEVNFRDVGMPAKIEWVENAFDHDGLRAPPLALEDPKREPKIKTGGPRIGGGGGDGEKTEVDVPRVFEPQEVEVDKLEPAA